ncbi:AI-2E family transporter [Spirosoma sp. HMF4905]|uniref:AI-2E family transporter n=1 Tax=Spirosoma arboris TaxID=2682092 RepID=A0A7K1SDH3_9BACT|nr:AI-2E family transporter [Spirosoma arboris]MVM31862.1 AI-2E family transporter [Spirosoma arboris]
MNQLPLTVKRSIELMGLCLLCVLILVGKAIIMPLIMAFFVSIVLLPVYRFLKKGRLPDSLAILLSILLMIVSGIVVIWFFSIQLSSLLVDFPQIKKTLLLHLRELSEFLGQKTHYSTQQQLQFFHEQNAKLLNATGDLLRQVATSLSSVFVLMGLMPIYVFLLLFYKNLLVRFVFLWFSAKDHNRVEEALRETESIIKSYLIGLLIQIAFIIVILGGTLQLLGIPHALLIGIILAFLNLIPYVGIFMGTFIGLFIILASSQELLPIVELIVVVVVVHFLDQNILRPRVVGSKVRINALTSIIGVVIGGHIAGVSGMFLSLPIIAILKVIFDRTDMFAKWGVLFGDENPVHSPMQKLALRIWKRS